MHAWQQTLPSCAHAVCSRDQRARAVRMGRRAGRERAAHEQVTEPAALAAAGRPHAGAAPSAAEQLGRRLRRARRRRPRRQQRAGRVRRAGAVHQRAAEQRHVGQALEVQALVARSAVRVGYRGWVRRAPPSRVMEHRVVYRIIGLTTRPLIVWLGRPRGPPGHS